MTRPAPSNSYPAYCPKRRPPKRRPCGRPVRIALTHQYPLVALTHKIDRGCGSLRLHETGMADAPQKRASASPDELGGLRGNATDCDGMKEEAPPGFEPGMADLQSAALPLGEGARNRRAHISERSLRGQSLLKGRKKRIDIKPRAAARMLGSISTHPTILILLVLPPPDQTSEKLPLSHLKHSQLAAWIVQ